MTHVNKNLIQKQLDILNELFMFKSAYQNDGTKRLIENYEAILEACMSNETKTKIGSYKGHPLFSIVKEYEKDGEKKESAYIKFGLGKAKAILAHLEELKKFVEDNDNGNTSATVDLSELTPEQQQMVNSFVNDQ